MTEFTFEMPVPPTLNNLYENTTHGRRKANWYKDWRSNVGLILKSKRLPKFTGRCEISIVMPAGVNGDIDNRIKATLDCMVSAQIIANDSKKYVRKVSAEWGDHESKDATVTVRVI